MSALRDYIERTLGQSVSTLTPLGGGDVAEAYCATLADGGQVFAKTRRNSPPDFFVTEAAGLSWLREADAVPIPEVLGVSDDPPALILEWIEQGRAMASTEADFGRALAALHSFGAPCFGREDRRSTGSRGLPNEPCESWSEFYASNRLLPLARLATDAGALPKSAIRDLEDVAGRLGELGERPRTSRRRVCTAISGAATVWSGAAASAG